MTRTDGYYWCKYKGEWQICHWRNDTNQAWSFAAYIDDSWWFYDEEFDEIDENRINREPGKFIFSTEPINMPLPDKLPSPENRGLGDKLFGLL